MQIVEILLKFVEISADHPVCLYDQKSRFDVYQSFYLPSNVVSYSSVSFLFGGVGDTLSLLGLPLAYIEDSQTIDAFCSDKYILEQQLKLDSCLVLMVQSMLEVEFQAEIQFSSSIFDAKLKCPLTCLLGKDSSYAVRIDT